MWLIYLLIFFALALLPLMLVMAVWFLVWLVRATLGLVWSFVHRRGRHRR